MEGGRQLKLLLWRDYLIRKRNFITLAGILWASGIMFGIYTVRLNVDNQDFSTCQFPARALPSAGMIPFLQSFICSVNNECSPMDQYEEIPAYENSTLTKIQRKIAPVMNETVIELASSMPDAVKLLATVAKVADEPTFLDFAKNGLKLEDLFKNPSRVKRYVTSRLQLDDDVAQSLMTSDISFQGIISGDMNKCKPDSISKTIQIQNKEHLNIFVRRLCNTSKEELQKMMLDLLYEVNLSKYIKMFGNMYEKMSGDNRLTKLGDFVTAVLRMTKLDNFLPPELLGIFQGKQQDFSYLNINLIQKFVKLFEPTFGDTEQYKSVNELADTLVVGVQYLHRIFGDLSSNNDTVDDITDVTVSNIGNGLNLKGFDKMNRVLNNAVKVVGRIGDDDKKSTIDPFDVLTQITNLIHKFIPNKSKHDVLFYSTILAKLMESANKVIYINMNIEDIIYNVTSRNSEAVKVMIKLPPNIIGKAFEALVSPERTQIVTSKLNAPGYVFCDIGKLEAFFDIAREEAENVKKQLCTDVWKNYVGDLVQAFGVQDVKDYINEMASLFIQETMGKDTSSQLYSIEQDFRILRNFTGALLTMEAERRPRRDWTQVLGVGSDSGFMKVVTEKAHLGKLILISVHGALAKEVVNQNVILQYKITPILLDTATMLQALSKQLELVPGHVTEGLKSMYTDVVRTVLLTAVDEVKTYKSLSTFSEDILCQGGENAENYLQISSDVDKDKMALVLCNAFKAIEDGLRNNSILSNAVTKIRNTEHTLLEQISWIDLVSSIQKLYVKINGDYPYVFEYSTYAMDKVTQDEIQKMLKEAKEYWFSLKNLQRGLHLSVNLGFRLLDLLDHDLFDMSSETWLKMKFYIKSLKGPLNIIDDVIRTIAGSLTNSTAMSDLPPITAEALGKIAPNLPNFIVDAVNILINDDTDIVPVIALMNAQPPWPCSSSLSELLILSPPSVEAVQGTETLLCLDVDLVDEWREYLDVKKARFNKTQKWNNTEFEPHLFLKMSATFDSLVNDTAIIKEAFNYIINDDQTDDHIGLMSAWKYAVDTLNTTDKGKVIGKFLSKFDTVLNSINTPLPNANISLNNLWEQYTKCFLEQYHSNCGDTGRAAWKYAFIMFAAVVDDVADDLTSYFTEINEPDSNPLQVLGFTRGTALYTLYDRLPQYVSVLLNSYWDYGFMAQIRRASLTSFWDCEALVSTLTPPPDSPISKEDILRVEPYLCPSLIYWLSMPKGDNVLFNLVAKPQYYIFSLAVENTTSYFETSYAKASALGNLIGNLTKENESLTKEFEINNMKNKLAKFVDKMLNYKINDTDPSYKEFTNIYKNKFMADIYLARIVTLTNQITNAFANLTIDENINVNKSEIDKLKADLSSVNIIYRRKSVDIIAIHFDLITDILWRFDVNYTLIDALENMCSNIKENRIILATEERVKLQICAKNYKVLYKSIENAVSDENGEARESILNLVKVLQDGQLDEATDIFEFLNNRTQLVESLRHSIKASYDLGLPHYLQYIQTNLHTYRLLITFLSGGDWWKDLTEVFNGPYAKDFFEYVENSFEIVDNFLNNLDGVHLVRLVRDMNLNETDSFCRPNITLSDYIPDSTGLLSRMKQQICATEIVDVFREIPPLLYASQGYENALKLSKDIDYPTLKQDISNTESRILDLQEPKEPKRPSWVTDEKIDLMRRDVMQLLNKESIAKVVFGVLSNGVDAGTLFLNSSECTLCSQLTTWFKQLNLQVFKKQEYDNLLCQVHTMTLQEVYYTLKNNFHWDMFIRELISSRNYTKYELNKSMNEFLDLVKVHFLEDLTAPSTKLTECLANNVTRNEFGNATLVISVLAHTTKLLQAETPYLQDIDGIKNVPYLKQLEAEVAPKLDVFRPIKDYFSKDGEVKFDGVDDAVLNLRVALTKTPSLENLIPNIDWSKQNYTDILNKILNNLDRKKIQEEIPHLQTSEYWRFPFMTSILHHLEGILSHTARLAGVVSTLEVRAAIDGRLDALLDVLVVLLTDDSVDAVAYSVYGLINELHPLLKDTVLEDDLDALAAGLKIIHQFKTYLMEEADLKLSISSYFHADGIESGLTALGINNTNFWSLAAPRIQDGYIDLKPVISPKSLPYHISSFACNMDTMSTAVLPSSLDVVTLEDVLGATVEQFCGLDQDVVMDVVAVLLRNVRFEEVVDKLKSFLLTKLYSASSLTPSEGETVLQRFPRMATLLPSLQGRLAEVLDLVMEEPLIEKLKGFTSVGNLLSSSDFFGDVGRMMCGKPFKMDTNRILQNIIKSKDQMPEVDQRQLDSLPSDFCRSMYQEIISLDGGKIVWSFIKPLLMGRILYSPDTPAVHTLMDKVNGTFSSMIRLSNLVHSFASAFPSLDSISNHRGGLQALQQLVNQPGMEDVRKGVLGDVELNVDVDGAFGQLDGFQDMGSLMSKASSLLHCIRLDRLSPVKNETALMHRAGQLMLLNEFSAGIVFLNPDELERSLKNVQYKIRMDIENAPTTNRLTSYLWTPGPEASFIENMRYFRGFIQVQDMIDKAIIQLSMEESRMRDPARRTKRDTLLRIEDSRIKEIDQARRTKRDTSLSIADSRKENSSIEDFDWAVYTQQMPYPCYRKDYFQNSLYESQALIVGYFFSLLFTVVSVVRFIVADKESGNTMLMSVMGVNLSYHTMSWFLASFVEVTATTTTIAVILKYAHILPRTDFSLILALLFLFGISVLSFCYMLSKMFPTAGLASVCAGILYLLSFMPFVLILSMEAVMDNSYKLFVCLFMSSSFSYCFVFITRYEAIGTGAHWAQLWDSPTHDGMSIGYAAMMMAVDAVIYFVIGWCIDRYFGIKSISHNTITKTSTTNEKAGVSIVSVSKVYGEGSRKAKVALDNVSMELQRGQITTLLGHNGAGKTTLIKILTGMLKACKGHVVIRDGPDSDTGRAGRAGHVGVCPQHDVLVECLTTREHVTLYAQLDARKGEDVEDMVDKMLREMSLARYGDVRASRLSGGTRRRLCVALAFVARAHLVVLDEPTAGVDPTNRRDIWSMVMKLKAGRTILLTTHHLDEAEILSDQIVIMHKGQIHTTGSPVEIKRSLGSGYKLTVSLTPRADADADADGDADGGERCKRILTAVRQVVRNAAVSDVTDSQVEIMLPFYDADGANNNFLALCTSLEEKQQTLGYSTFVLDCSSLEQVFHDICSKADGKDTVEYATEDQPPSSSGSSSSLRSSQRALVGAGGARRGHRWEQFKALMWARALSLIRNRSLAFMVLILPTIFVTVAMAFSTIRPPADNEIALPLTERLYDKTTQFLMPYPSMHSDNIDPSFAIQVMNQLKMNKDARNWTQKDTPTCKCLPNRQECAIENVTRPEMMLLPDANTLNDWLVNSQQVYIMKRYGGYTSSILNNRTHYLAWYNNKGHHAMPTYVSSLNNAILRSLAGNEYNITTYSHPMKISKEQLSKDTVYQRIADAGVSALVLVALALCGAGGAAPLVSARARREDRLQRLAAVTPTLYWTAALASDMMVMLINMVLTAIVMAAFGFPVFTWRNNLPAICLLIMLYGFACCSLVHVLQKLFSDASLANMILFCGNAFCGLIGITILLILDVISESDRTDNARWVLHKVFLLAPQFALGDGLLEIAKNTVQAEVLVRFGMDTYLDPFSSDLLTLHYCYLVVVGICLVLLNLAIEGGYFYWLLDWFSPPPPPIKKNPLEPEEISAERRRVAAARSISHETLSLPTLGNINKGFVDTEGKKNSLQRTVVTAHDVLSCEGLSKVYGGACAGATDRAVSDLTVGVQPGQCLALLGENGAGKSTTFSMWAGETRPTAGTIALHGVQRNQRGLCRGLISYCPQSDAVDPLLTVRETLQLYCRLRGIAEEDEVVQRTLEMFNLTKYAAVRAGALSGGNRRKLCAGVAVAARAPLLLLDEPTSGMDPVSRACVWRGVSCARAAGRAVVLSTHALDDARRAATRVALMRRGELAALASLQDCLDRFGGGYVVSCRCGSPARAWRRVSRAAPRAQLRMLHCNTLHFHMPTRVTVEKKEVVTRLSDIFCLMRELQATTDIEDFTVNQSSLEQMFLNFSEKSELNVSEEPEPEVELELEPEPEPFRRNSAQLDSVTSL